MFSRIAVFKNTFQIDTKVQLAKIFVDLGQSQKWARVTQG